MQKTQYTMPYYGLFYGLPNTSALIAELSGDFVNFSPGIFIAQTKEEVLNKAVELNITDIDYNQSIYFNLPNGHSLANIRRAGSSALSTSIANTFFPDLSAKEGLHINTVIPLSSTPTGTPHAVVRHPIDRFISAYAKKVGGVPKDLSVDEFITWLEKQDLGTLNWHFRPQTTIIGSFSGTQYYDFNKGLDAVAANIGLPTPVDTINETDPSDKPVLTEEQISRLNTLYASDLTLYASISSN